MKLWMKVAALACALVGSVGAWNYLSVGHPVASRLSQDVRNEKVSFLAYHRYGVIPSTLVVDLRHISNEATMADVLRALLQSADVLKDKRFEHVFLAYRGTNKFQLEGGYFQTLGQEYAGQNPAYTLRTLPENVFKLDGSPAFGRWTGGLLGVLGKQMEDFNQFSHDWYLDDAVKESVSDAASAR